MLASPSSHDVCIDPIGINQTSNFPYISVIIGLVSSSCIDSSYAPLLLTIFATPQNIPPHIIATPMIPNIIRFIGDVLSVLLCKLIPSRWACAAVVACCLDTEVVRSFVAILICCSITGIFFCVSGLVDCACG